MAAVFLNEQNEFDKCNLKDILVIWHFNGSTTDLSSNEKRILTIFQNDCGILKM